jgi:hypothetical protein
LGSQNGWTRFVLITWPAISPEERYFSQGNDLGEKLRHLIFDRLRMRLGGMLKSESKGLRSHTYTYGLIFTDGLVASYYIMSGIIAIFQFSAPLTT